MVLKRYGDSSREVYYKRPRMTSGEVGGGCGCTTRRLGQPLVSCDCEGCSSGSGGGCGSEEGTASVRRSASATPVEVRYAGAGPAFSNSAGGTWGSGGLDRLSMVPADAPDFRRSRVDLSSFVTVPDVSLSGGAADPTATERGSGHEWGAPLPVVGCYRSFRPVDPEYSKCAKYCSTKEPGAPCVSSCYAGADGAGGCTLKVVCTACRETLPPGPGGTPFQDILE